MSLQIRESDLSFIRSRLAREEAQRALRVGFDLGDAMVALKKFFGRVGPHHSAAALERRRTLAHTRWE
jgi:hypothetical protein